MCAYKTTKNKDAIRIQWDLPILERWRESYGKPLAYFGLPGPEIQDLLTWKHILGVRTGVEDPGRTKQERIKADDTMGRLNMNVLVHGLSSGFQLLRADIADVILNATDTNGIRPLQNDGQPAHLAHFTYDLVNLDFDGGLGYTNKQGTAKRVNAIKKIFERQEGHSFILLLTINVRDTLGDEIETYLRGLRARHNSEEWQQIIDFYLSRGNGEREYKLKATIPSFIRTISETRMFRTLCRPPIAYEGHEKAHMIHFVFECESQPGNLIAFSDQDDLDLLRLPLIRCKDGVLRLAEQDSEFDMSNSAQYFHFLPKRTAEMILCSV